MCIRDSAMGESSQSGGWAGVGTNGGTNLFILINSCGFRWRNWLDDSKYMFAGMHLLFVNSPVSGFTDSTGKAGHADTAQCLTCGSTLASYIMSNLDAPANEAWTNPTLVNSSYLCAGDPGVNCGHSEGVNVVMSKDTTATAATNRATYENWYAVQMNSYDAHGADFAYRIGGCNYDCVQYG